MRVYLSAEANSPHAGAGMNVSRPPVGGGEGLITGIASE
jgi:hypothetical protein